jgi:hypothetical protein
MSFPELVGKAYTAQLGLEPGDQFVFKLGQIHRQADKHLLPEQCIGQMLSRPLEQNDVGIVGIHGCGLPAGFLIASLPATARSTAAWISDAVMPSPLAFTRMLSVVIRSR